jgi:hypothetical protein
VRSARGTTGTALAALPIAVLLTGCVTTQHIAARTRLVNARILASQTPTEVVTANPEVTVTRTVLIRAGTGTAVAVALVNDSTRTLTDLPISVGTLTRAGQRVYLNRSGNLDYFQSHIAAIRPHASVSWVFTTGRRVATGARPFATVGAGQLPATVPRRLPQIAVSVRRAVGAAAQTVELAVSNRSAVPQYDLPLYAVAVRDGRPVAAGSASVAHLGTHGRTTVQLSLIGNSRQAALELAALPTIFS